MTAQPALLSSVDSLVHRYDVALLDLDGVVYVGPQAVPGAPRALSQAREAGMSLAFVTNNAARTATQVAEHLTDLGIPAQAAEVTTSSQAAARYLAERLPAGSRVLAIGAVGLTEALRERGLEPVDSADADPLAVVQGYSPETNWAMLAEASIAVNRGLLWVATNLDATLPSPRGPLPGNGSLIAAVQRATGRSPIATGKPDPTMHRESLERSGARNPVVVGDRLDTDIEGANAVGCASLLVLSGVTDAGTLLRAQPRHRPNFIGQDVSALLLAHSAPVASAAPDGGFSGGRWRSWRENDSLFLAESESIAPPLVADGLDAVRVLCATEWATEWATERAAELTTERTADRVSAPAGTGVRPSAIVAGDAAAAAELARFGLA